MFAACPAGYERNEEICYKLVTEIATANAAQATCLAEGNNLVTINDAAENEYIKGKYR